jgi:hypothetical protein
MHCPHMRTSPNFRHAVSWVANHPTLDLFLYEITSVYPAVEHELKTFSKTSHSQNYLLVGIAKNYGLGAKLWSWISWVMHGGNTGRNVLYACAEGGNLPLTSCPSCPCRVRFMLYFETRVQTSLLGMRILEFSGMVGYLGFRVRPDLLSKGRCFASCCLMIATGVF